MNSNSKSTVCGNLISKKPNRKSGVSSAELVNRTGKTGVSPPNGKAVVFSDVPIKHSGGTGQMKNLELRLLTTLMLVLDVFLCLPEFKHWHGEVKANLAAACLIPFLCSKIIKNDNLDELKEPVMARSVQCIMGNGKNHIAFKRIHRPN
ncbi:unnamed protein product [Brassica rapa subsp. trilocularis]|uniref:Uncharacterized protein n=1 Tax=Brassica campestris TaxID=3711 RepID=M4D6T2_BRACM